MERQYTWPDVGTLRAPHDPHADGSHAYVGWTLLGKGPGAICRMNSQASPDVANKRNPSSPKRPAHGAKRKAAARASKATEVAGIENDICEMEERLEQLEVFNKFDLDGSGAQSVLGHCMHQPLVAQQPNDA